MASGYCQICINYHLLPDFLFFNCGHGFCTSCIGALFRGRKKTTCPNCRVPVARQDARAIFFDIIDPKVSGVISVIEGLSKMGEDSKLVSVRKAEEKIRKAAENLEADKDTAVMLLRAVDNFKERIIPTFTKLEAQMEEIASLRKDLHDARYEKEQINSRCKKARKIEMDAENLKESLLQVSSERDRAISLAEQACRETVKLREAEEVSARTLSVLEEENERYRNQLRVHMKLERTRKDKISRLKQEVIVLKETIHLNENNNTLHSPVQPVNVTYPSTQDILMPLRSAHTPSLTFVARDNPIRHDFEGMPAPSFASGWQLGAPSSKKRRNSAMDKGERKLEFPIGLNKGHPTKTVQLGPKKSLRTPLGLN